MKPITLFILIWSSLCFSCAECFADQASGQLTRQFVEHDSDKDGIADARMEIVSRGDEQILMLLSRAAKDSDGLVLQERSFLVGGEIVMCESDKDGDGSLETLTFYRPDTKVMEVFMREEDGTVRPSAEGGALRAIQEQQVTALWEKILAPDQTLTPGEAMQLIDEVRQGIHKHGR